MPKVGGRKFEYTKKGMARAKRYAKKIGKRMTMQDAHERMKYAMKMER